MKSFIVACLVVALFGAIAMADETLPGGLGKIGESSDAAALWPQYKLSFKKTYAPAEEASRYENFKKCIEKIKEHNKKYVNNEESYEQGVNESCDQTDAEKQRRLGFGGRKKRSPIPYERFPMMF